MILYSMIVPGAVVFGGEISQVMSMLVPPSWGVSVSEVMRAGRQSGLGGETRVLRRGSLDGGLARRPTTAHTR